MRCHQARALDRKQSKRLYEPTDVRYGTSAYDELSFKLRPPAEGDPGHWVYAVKMILNEAEVELLSQVEADPNL